MAQRNPTRSESIADLVDDLKVLRVSPTGYGTDFNSMVKEREERIKELNTKNVTLEEVHLVFFFFFFGFSFYKNLFNKNIEAEIDPDFKNILRTYPS